MGKPCKFLDVKWSRSRLWHGEGAAKPGFKDRWVVRTLRVLDSVSGVGRGGLARVALKLAAFEPRRHALPVQSCNFMVRIGHTRGLLTPSSSWGKSLCHGWRGAGCTGSVQGECTGRVQGRRCRERGVGFTLCVSAAVETTGWHHAQQHRRRGELQCSAKLGVAQGAPWGWGSMAPPAKR